jgi:hypothetical protein
MRLYPQLPDRLLRTLAADGITFLLLLIFALVGLKVHDAVDKLAVLGQGVHDAGSAVKDGFDSAADAVDDVPVVGGDVAGGLRDAGGASGGNVADLGQSGVDGVHRLANLLGLLTFLVPAAFVLWRQLPLRIEQVRRLSAAERVLRGADPRLVASRAAFGLPYGRLLEHTRDPLGDLAAERYEPLVAAELDAAGLRGR